MMVTERTPIGDIVAKNPRAAGVFEKYQIDYCCHGDRSLAEACQAAGVPAGEVIAEVTRTALESSLDRDWTLATLSELAAFIVSVHHRFLKDTLPLVEARIEKVIAVHGTRHGESLYALRLSFMALKREIEGHLLKEELVLFPAIERYERAHLAREKRPVAPFASIRAPIRMMEREHESAGQSLSEMRRVTGHYTVPLDGCSTYRALFDDLVRLEGDLHRHIHLENNILFPRAASLEAAFE